MILSTNPKRRYLGLLAGLAAGFSMQAQAALVHDFQLDGDASDALGGAAIATEGGTFDATGYRFDANQGLTLNAPAIGSVYSIETRFSLDSTGGYVKLIDYSDLVDDEGMYNDDGYADFYPEEESDGIVFSPGELVTLLLTRDAAGTVSVFLDDVFSFDFDDAASEYAALASAATPLRFFQDDFDTDREEATSGYVDYVRIYDTAIVPGASVPAPGSLALFLLAAPLLGRRMMRSRGR